MKVAMINVAGSDCGPITRGFRICARLQTVNSGDEGGLAASTYEPDGADAPLLVLCGTFPLMDPCQTQ